MSKVGLLYDKRFLRHVTGPGHPESPTRLQAIGDALEKDGLLDSCERVEPAAIPEAMIQSVHSHAYLVRLDAACRQNYPYIDVPDSAVCPESYDIAKLAAGGVAKTARMIGDGVIKRAFCAVRPPGHHAEADRSMGFCMLNNIALAAMVLKEEFKLRRILIFDWDVHHGNGTQHTFEMDPSVLFISLHGHPNYLYPGTGFEHEVGEATGHGYTMNIPLEPGADDDDVRKAFKTRIIPAVGRFAPQAILVSAGFDAHRDDPLGNLHWSDEVFAWMTEKLIELADRHAEGRLMSVLEGGYNLDVLGRCACEHVRIMQQAT